MKILGLDIVDLGKNVFGGVHTAGKTLASAFGYKGAADSLENLETKAGMLPDWAKSKPTGGTSTPTPADTDTAVTNPDYVVIARQPPGQKPLKPFVFDDAVAVGVVGGTRFDGSGYKLGDGFGNKFSFGIDSPKRVDVIPKNGAKTSYADVKQVLFCGGAEAKTHIVGMQRSARMGNGKKIVGEYSDMDIDTEGEFTIGDAYTVGADVLGAVARTTSLTPGRPATVPARAGITVKTAPMTGRQFTSLVISRPAPGAKKHDNATSVKNAKDAGARAVSVGNKVKDQLKTQGIHGIASPKPVARPAGKLSATDALKVKKAADAAIKAGNEVIKLADKHTTVYTGAKAKKDAGVKGVQAKYNPANNGKTNIHGMVLGAISDMIGDDINYMIGDPPPISDPLNPGYMTDGSIDPTYGATGTMPYGSTPTYGATPPYGAAPGVADTMPGPPDYGLGAAPSAATVAPKEGVDYVKDPGSDKDSNIYSSLGDGVPLPLGAVIYDGSHPFPEHGVGSFTYFYSQLTTGEKPDGGGGSGFYWNGNKWRYWWASSYNDGIAIDTRAKDLNAEETASLQAMAQSSINHKWGPLIGSPKTGWTKGLRYDFGGDQWFWYRDKAPSWATAADDAVRLNQAVLDYKAQVTAAAADYAAAQAQDKLDAQNAAALAKQQAAEDAQTAHQQQIEMQAAQQQANLQMAAQPAAQAALDQQYQAAQIAQQQQQAQLDQQYQQMQMQMQQQQAQQAAQANDLQLQYAQQHPDVFQSMFQPQQMPGIGPQMMPSDQGGFGGGYAPQDDSDPNYDPESGVNWGASTRDTYDRSSDMSAVDLEDDI